MEKCNECDYRGTIPGDCHSTCSFDFKKAELPLPKFNSHGVKMGWCFFPANFDPIWLSDCPAFAEIGTGDPEYVKERDEFSSIIDMLYGNI